MEDIVALRAYVKQQIDKNLTDDAGYAGSSGRGLVG